MDDARRCVRADRCEDRETVVDDQGDRITYGAVTAGEHRALCDTCIRQLRFALQRLPLDVAELTTLLVPTAAVTYRSPDLPAQPRVKLSAPLPLNAPAEGLRALIDHEVTAWAESLADDLGMPWDSRALATSRIGHRIVTCCTFILGWLDHFLGLPAQEHRARSAGEDPLTGHDLDRVTYDGRDYWVRRNGTEAALVLLNLHLRALAFAGWNPVDRVPVPCPACERPAMVRERPIRKVVCRCCWREMTDDAYEALIDVLGDTFGVAG